MGQGSSAAHGEKGARASVPHPPEVSDITYVCFQSLEQCEKFSPSDTNTACYLCFRDPKMELSLSYA